MKSETKGTLGAIATIAGVGATVLGASASVITSTLATAGTIIGGGMAAGAIVIAAAPLAVFGTIVAADKSIKKIK